MEDIVIQNKMFDIFQEYSQWNKVLKVSNLADLNSLCNAGKDETLIKVSEALHEKKIGHIADMVEERKEQVKIILISGPSSSGKTTFSKRLAIQLVITSYSIHYTKLYEDIMKENNTSINFYTKLLSISSATIAILSIFFLFARSTSPETRSSNVNLSSTTTSTPISIPADITFARNNFV